MSANSSCKTSYSLASLTIVSCSKLTCTPPPESLLPLLTCTLCKHCRHFANAWVYLLSNAVHKRLICLGYRGSVVSCHCHDAATCQCQPMNRIQAGGEGSTSREWGGRRAGAGVLGTLCCLRLLTPVYVWLFTASCQMTDSYVMSRAMGRHMRNGE